MEMQFTAEQDDLRRSLRRFLEQQSPATEVRRLMDTAEGYDPEVWKRLSGELGLTGLAVPEEHGGAGCGQIELSVVFEEMGRALLCAPYLATVLATEALLRAGDATAQAEFLPGIAEGSTIATVALCGDSGSWSLSDLPVSASGSGDSWTLDGSATLVLDGTVASLLLVVAGTPDGPSLFAVSDTSGLSRKGLQTLDMTRKLASVDFSGASARLVGKPGSVATWWPRFLQTARVCLAAEQVGGAQWCLDTSVEYAKLRYQFNRPVGSFQAVKHRLADMLLDVENARSAAYYATFTLADGGEEAMAEAVRVVPLTSAVCAEAYRRVTADCIQVHGGIAFTWEHDAHLYYRRAGSSALQFGDAANQWQVLADDLLAAPTA
ncbi:MAG TPA: acyl-CoA dehydrogenase family protein [Mycobacteriales bacterium]